MKKTVIIYDPKSENAANFIAKILAGFGVVAQPELADSEEAIPYDCDLSRKTVSDVIVVAASLESSLYGAIDFDLKMNLEILGVPKPKVISVVCGDMTSHGESKQDAFIRLVKGDEDTNEQAIHQIFDRLSEPPDPRCLGLIIRPSQDGDLIMGNGVLISGSESNVLIDRFRECFNANHDRCLYESTGDHDANEQAFRMSVRDSFETTFGHFPEELTKEGSVLTELAGKVILFDKFMRLQFLDDVEDAERNAGTRSRKSA